MKKRSVSVFVLLAATLGVLSACGSSSDNTSVEPQVTQELHSLRAYEPGIYDHYYEFSKILDEGELVAKIVRYKMPDCSKRVKEWEKTLTPLQSNSLHVTDVLVHGTKVYLAGYHTLSMDEDLNNLDVNARANGFLVEVDTGDGTILGSTVIHSESEVPESVVIPLSIALDGEEIRINGESTGGIAVGSTYLQPESARDAFTIFYDPEDGRVVSASLTPMVMSPPVTAGAKHAASAGKGSEMADAGGIVGDFLGNFEATAGANWVQSKILNELGFQNGTQKALGEINTQLTEVNTQLANIDTYLKTYLGDFTTIYNAILKQNSTIAGDMYTYFQTNIQGYYGAYTDAIGSGSEVTLQTVYDNPGTFIENFYTSPQVSQATLNNNLHNLLDTLQGTSGLPASMYNQMAALVKEIPGSNPPASLPDFDGYNEGLMNLYGTAIQAIQIVYTIQSTYIYVASEDPNDANNTNPREEMKNWDIGVSGVLKSQSYSDNQAALNAYYKNLVQTTFNDVAQYLITDIFDRLPAQALSDGWLVKYVSPYTPKQATTLQGMPSAGTPGDSTQSHAHSWTTACSIYVWSGVLSDPSTTAYEGSWGKNQMTVRCSALGSEPLTLDLSNIQPGSGQTTAGVNYFHMDDGLQGKPVDQLQPAPPAYWAPSYVGIIFDPTNFNTDDFGYGQMLPKGHHMPIYVSTNWDAWPTSTTDSLGNNYVAVRLLLSGNLDTSVMNQLKVTNGNPYWAILNYLSPQGLSYYFWLGGKFYNKHYCVQVQCGKPADPNICAQGQGFSYGSKISFAGDNVVNVCTNGTKSEHAMLSPGSPQCTN